MWKLEIVLKNTGLEMVLLACIPKCHYAILKITGTSIGTWLALSQLNQLNQLNQLFR